MKAATPNESNVTGSKAFGSCSKGSFTLMESELESERTVTETVQSDRTFALAFVQRNSTRISYLHPVKANAKPESLLNCS